MGEGTLQEAHVVFYFFNNFVYLFILTSLGLSCCDSFFSGCGSPCTGFSLRGLLLLWRSGSRGVDFNTCSSRAQ